MGFVFTPPTTVAEIEGFLKAKAKGEDYLIGARPLSIEEMCDTHLRLHGPSLKGGINDRKSGPYYGQKLRMEKIKKFWHGKFAHEIGKLDIRDYLAQFKTAGTRMRYLGVLGNMFRSYGDWNEDELQKINGPVRLPKHNPVKKWRAEMKPHEKREVPDSRVLTGEEWAKFWKHLSGRARPICEVALRRFLRLADIKRISYMAIVNGHIKGLQEKTGDPFSIPVMSDHAQKYDFTNFVAEFKKAQIKAGLDFPPGHAKHFSIKDLRRTGATWAYQKTKDIRSISKMLGHRKTSTTERYLNITDADTMAVAKAMDILAAVKTRSRK